MAGPRLLAEPGAPDLAGHLRRYGAAPLDSVAGGRLVDAVIASGLRGRGGAAYPTGAKLAAVAATGRRPVVVANAAEGEPACAKDDHLLQRAPHLVLDGLALVAAALDARDAVVWAAPRAERGLTAAVADRRSAGLDRNRLRVLAAAHGFVGGESSAVARRLRGGPAKPAGKMPRPAAGRVPTLVCNAETLAHVALIARYGAAWFSSVGTAASPGTALLTVRGGVRTPQVLEVPLGASLGTVLHAAGGPAGPVAAVLIGGYHGAWLAPDPDLPLSVEGLRAAGGVLGAGAVVVLPAGRCGLAETARIAGWLAAESAGQCGPCRFGLPALAEALAGLADGRPGSAQRVAQLAGLVDGRGACAHPDGAARLVRSALEAFSWDVARHEAGAPCAAVLDPVLPLPGALRSPA